jgi:hypothetical protein
LPDVRRPDARSAQIGGPDGISQSFQVSAYSGEPFTSILARNLFPKHSCRSALADERVKSGPKVSLVFVALSFSSARKRLTGTRTCPDGLVFRPTGEAQCVRPSSDAGEEMALDVSAQVVWPDIADASVVNVSVWDKSG